MPMTQEKNPKSFFMRALKQTPNWKTAYLDNTQHLLVNINTPQGKQLIDKILADEAIFPDSYCKNITTSTAISENNDRERFNDLYPLIKGAFEERQDSTSTLGMIRVASLPKIRPKIAADLQTYLDDFIQHQNVYQKQAGYYHRLASAELSIRFLSTYRPKEKKKYEEFSEMFRAELKILNKTSTW